MLFPDSKYAPRPTGQVAERIIIPAERLAADPTLAHLVATSTSKIWLGPKRHVVTYTIRKLQLFNIVLCGPGAVPIGTYNRPVDLAEVAAKYADFEPVVRSLISKASSCHRWMLSEMPPVPSWSDPSGRLVLLGDAAHAMVPFVAQGGAQCIEDAGVLAECLARVHSRSELPELMQIYTDLRKPRAEKVQRLAAANTGFLKLPDGPAQRRRDTMLAKSLEATYDSGLEDKAERNQDWLYSYDAVGEATRLLAKRTSAVL